MNALYDMTPKELVDQLSGFEHLFFSMMFAGKAAKKMYRMFEYSKSR